MAVGQKKQAQCRINPKSFEEMCKIQCTREEIIAILCVSQSTLQRWCNTTYGENFEAVYKRFSSNGKMCLRRNQMKLSETNSTMAIWLGKQMLGQTENPIPEQVEDDNIESNTLNEIRKHGLTDEDCEVQQ